MTWYNPTVTRGPKATRYPVLGMLLTNVVHYRFGKFKSWPVSTSQSSIKSHSQYSTGWLKGNLGRAPLCSQASSVYKGRIIPALIRVQSHISTTAGHDFFTGRAVSVRSRRGQLSWPCCCCRGSISSSLQGWGATWQPVTQIRAPPKCLLWKAPSSKAWHNYLLNIGVMFWGNTPSVTIVLITGWWLAESMQLEQKTIYLSRYNPLYGLMDVKRMLPAQNLGHKLYAVILGKPTFWHLLPWCTAAYLLLWVSLIKYLLT